MILVYQDGQAHRFPDAASAYEFIRADDEKHCGPEDEKWRNYWETLLARFRQIS